MRFCGHATAMVLNCGNHLQMIDVDTSAVPAEMIDNQPIGNLPVLFLPRYAMSAAPFSRKADAAITILVNISGPFLARRMFTHGVKCSIVSPTT